MLPICICEDNFVQLQTIRSTIEKYILIEDLDMKVRLACSSPEELLSAVAVSHETALYFLDVDLNASINGIELAEKIREYDSWGFIVFITIHAQMAPLTFLHKVEAMDFISKDNQTEMKNHICACLSYAIEKLRNNKVSPNDMIAIPLKDKTITLPLSDILFIEASTRAHKIKIHTATGITEIYKTLREIGSLLDSRFFQCHKSCIVNITKIKEIDKKRLTVIFANGQSCDISTRRLKSLGEMYKCTPRQL